MAMNQKNNTPWTTLTHWENRFKNKDTPWDQGHASPSLIEIEKKYPPEEEAKVFIPGCGTGNEALYFAQLGYRISALDGSKSALEILKKKAKEEGLEDQIEIICDDFWKYQPKEKYDVIIEHTFFCAIDPSQRSDFSKKIAELLVEDGKYYGVFLVSDEQVDSPPFYTTEKEIRQCFEKDFNLIVLERSPVSEYPWGSKQWWAYFTRK